MPDSTQHKIVATLVDAQLSSGDTVRFWVTSNSMFPILQIRDAITVQAIELEKVETGDIVVIQRARDYLTHRIVFKSAQKWLSKGDNNLVPDRSSFADEIRGRVTRIQRSDKIIDLQTRKWRLLNPLLAKLSLLEWKAFSIQRYLRLPFRLAIKAIQKIWMRA